MLIFLLSLRQLYPVSTTPLCLPLQVTFCSPTCASSAAGRLHRIECLNRLHPPLSRSPPNIGMCLAMRVLINRKASNWATLFDGKHKECLCTWIEDYRGFFTEEEKAQLDLGKVHPCACLIHIGSVGIMDNLGEFYFSASEMYPGVRERSTRLLNGLRICIWQNTRGVNKVANQGLFRTNFGRRKACQDYVVYFQKSSSEC